MIPSASRLKTASIMGRFVAGKLVRKITAPNREPDHAGFRDRMAAIIRSAPPGAIGESEYFFLDATTPPWIDTGLDLRAGAVVTTIALGRVYLNKPLDIYATPEYALWARVGEDTPIFSGTRDTNTFTAESAGRLYLATLTGEWGGKTGKLATPVEQYKTAAGGISVQVVVWSVAALEGLKKLAEHGDISGLIASEIDRIQNAKPKPEGWDFLWFLGRSEIYHDAATPKGEPSIHCHTKQNVCILQKDAPFDLTPETRLEWTWKVDELPSDFAECTLPTHDYMSIAVEFDDGQDLTYYWSHSLPVETCYRCPLPSWNHRETHLVVRSGKQGLGEWLRESRNVYEDCGKAYGEAPKKIVRVWLIANSLLQRKQGICEYANAVLTDGNKTLRVI